MIYTAEKTKTDLKDKISKEQEEKLDKGIADLKEVLKSKDIEKMKSSSEKLGKILQEISAQAYQQASTAQQAESQKQAEGEAGEKEEKKEKVVDADYKVVDEDKDKKSSTDEPQ
jgi:molecular chaperone DnaK